MSCLSSAIVAGGVWYQPQPQRSSRGENSNQKPGSSCCLARRKVSHMTSRKMGSSGPRRVSRQMREMLFPTFGMHIMAGSISSMAGVSAVTSSAMGSTTSFSYSSRCSWNQGRESVSLLRTRNSRVSSVKGKICASSPGYYNTAARGKEHFVLCRRLLPYDFFRPLFVKQSVVIYIGMPLGNHPMEVDICPAL